MAAAAAALGVPGPLARSRLRKVTGPGALPTAAARICATAAAALPPPLSANGHRAPPRPRRRPAHAGARSRTGPPGAGPGVTRVRASMRASVRACGGLRAAAARPPRVGLPPRRRPDSPLGTLGSGVPRPGVGSAPRRGRADRAACVRACARVRACACAAALRAGLCGAHAPLRLPCSIASGK